MRKELIAKILRHYDVFIPIVGRQRQEIFILTDQRYYYTLVWKGTKDTQGRDLLRLSDYKQDLVHQMYDAILVYSDEGKVWLIPTDDIFDNKTLLLNEKKNCYLISDDVRSEKVKDAEDIKHQTISNIKSILKETEQ